MSRAILYRWRLKPGREAEFRAAWAEGTRRIHQACKSYGARLHQGEDGLYWSYALWPSEEVRKACFAGHDWFSQDCFQTMQACIAQRFDEIPLSLTDDALTPPTPRLEPVLLSTQRLLLRPMAFEDCEAFLPALSDPATMKYWSRGPLTSLDEVRDYLGWNIRGDGVESFVLVLQDAPQEPLGWVVLMDRKNNCAELGYMLRPDQHGHGYAREAATAVVEHGFDARGLRRIYADTDPDNAASIQLLESLGFQLEGHLRASWETHIGVRDSLIFGRLGPEADTAPPKMLL
jgi:ribosomal-protein-alanine N-acetyltransferase